MNTMTHIRIPKPARFDAFVAAYVVRMYGEPALPGASQAIPTYETGNADTTFDVLSCVPLPVFYKSLTYHVADRLGVKQKPEVRALLNLVADAHSPKRTAFGFVQRVIRAYNDQPQEALAQLTPFFESWIRDQEIVAHEKDITEKLHNTNEIRVFPLIHGDTRYTVALCETSMQGAAQSVTATGEADIAIQNTGAQSLLLAAKGDIALDEAVKVIRVEEGRKRSVEGLAQIPKYTFMNDGVVEPICEWFFDKAANTLSTTTTTKLTTQEILSALLIGLSKTLWEKKCPPTGCRGARCYFYDYGLQRCRAREIAQIGDDLNTWKLEPQGHAKETLQTKHN